MVTQNRVLVNTLDGTVCHEHAVDVAEEGVGGVLCHCDLELLVVFSTLSFVIGLAGQGQVLVHIGVGVAGVISALVGTKDLVGVIVSIERTSPADDAALLSAPVDAFRRNICLNIQTNLLKLLGSDLGHVDTNLIAGSGVDREADAFPVTAPVALCVLLATDRFQNLSGLFGVVVVVLHAVIVVLVQLNGAVGGEALAQQNGIHDGLTVDCVVHFPARRDSRNCTGYHGSRQ